MIGLDTAWRRKMLMSACALAVVHLDPDLGQAQLKSQSLGDVQARMVKVYGAGGYANLHSYQTGFFISSDGEILTTWSHVLDGKITVVDSAGKRRVARFVGMDVEQEFALIQVDGKRDNFFDLEAKAPELNLGETVYAISNLYGIAQADEPLSLMRGVLSARSRLNAVLGEFSTSYQGKILLVDLIANNPGAAGGVLVDSRGQLVGVLGKELRDRETGVWLNYAIPVTEVLKSIKRMRSERTDSAVKRFVPSSIQLNDIGLELVPNSLARTRPFVDEVRRGSAAEKAGLLPDDLIVFVDRKPVRSISELTELLSSIDRDSTLQLTVRRGVELVRFELSRAGRALRIENRDSLDEARNR